MSKIDNKYKLEQKQYKSNQLKTLKTEIAHKLGLHFHWYKDAQVKKILDANLAPDVSTVTERIAFVVDGEVVEVMYCQPKLAAILLSNPEIVDTTLFTDVKPGYWYQNGKLFDPMAKQ